MSSAPSSGRALSPWAKDQRRRNLELGAKIVAKKSRGMKWTDLVTEFRLSDEHAARKLAVGFLLSLVDDADREQDPARPGPQTRFKA